MYPILFTIGPVTIYTYGVALAIGVLVGLCLAIKEGKRELISPNKIIDLFLWIIISGFIGARVVYIFTEWNYFLKYPARVLFASEGFVFYGGFITAFLTAFWYTKRRNIKQWQMADIMAPSIAIAQAIGRIGCFFYGCCYGIPTNSRFGILFPPNSPAGELRVPVIPTQLISSFALLVIFLLLNRVKKRKKFDGQVFWFYVLLYAIARFIIEYFRADPRGMIWVFSTSQFIAIIMAAVALFVIARSKATKQSLSK